MLISLFLVYFFLLRVSFIQLLLTLLYVKYIVSYRIVGL